MKSTLVFLSALLFFSIPQINWGQCNTQTCPMGVVSPALCAEEACVIASPSDLNGFEGSTTPDFNACDIPGPFCGSIENNRWFAFIAPNSTITFSFEVENCVGTPNGGGIQAEVYSTNDCNNFVSVSNCWSDGEPGPGSVVAFDLTVGEVYYLMIDAWAGDICEYTIIVECEALGSGGALEVSFAGPTVACPGETTAYVAGFFPCLSDVEWSFDGNGTMNINSNLSAVFVDWGAPSEGTICLTATLPDGEVEEFCLTVQTLELTATPLIVLPELDVDNVVELCANDLLHIEVDDPSGGTAELTYTYFFGGSGLTEGKEVDHQFSFPGTYECTIVATSEDCNLVDSFFFIANVLPAPTVHLGIVPNDTLCTGEEITLTLETGIDTFFNYTNIGVEETYDPAIGLPDGNGASVDAVLSVSNGQPGEILTSVESLRVCVNMEHSWMRDLEIRLTCPAGQSVILHNHPGQLGGEVFLGVPFEGDEGMPEPIPGEGFPYCWTTDADNGTMIEYANTFAPNTLPAGDYSPFEPLENLLGCPINGDWVLSVIDLWAIDNGVLFDASFELEVLDSNFVVFESHAEWLPSPSIDFFSTDSIVASPVEAGSFSYLLSNDLGCSSVEEVPFEVLPENNPFCLPCDSLTVEVDDVLVTCDQGLPVFVIANASYPVWEIDFEWTRNGVLVSSTNGVLVNNDAQYIITASYPPLGCVASDTLVFIVDNQPPIADAGPDVELTDCPDGPFAFLDGSNSSSEPEIEYQWTGPNSFFSNEAIASTSETGIYSLVVTNTENGCTDLDATLVAMGDDVFVEVETTPDSCDLSIGTASVVFSPAQSDVTYLWSNGSTTATVTDLSYGQLAVSVNWSACPTFAIPVFIDSLVCEDPISGLMEIPGLESVFVSPNPTTGQASIFFHLEKPIQIELSVLDGLGREVKFVLVSQILPEGEQVIHLDLEGLPSGIYFLKMQSEGRIKTMKVILE